MRKIFLFSILIVLMFSQVVFASGEEKTSKKELLYKLGFTDTEINDLTKNTFSNSELNKLLKKKDILRFAQLGFSKEAIKDLDKEDIEYWKGIEGTLLNVDVKYMKLHDENGFIEVTKEQYLDAKKRHLKKENERHFLDTNKKDQLTISSICDPSSSTCSDTEPTENWITLTTSISSISNTSPQEYLIKHEYTWLKKPNYTYKDAFGVATHPSLSPIQNSEYAKITSDKYYSRNPIIGLGPWYYDEEENRYYWSANDKTGGMAFEVDLHSDYTYGSVQYEYRNHRGMMAYRAIRNNSSYTYGDML